MTKTAGFLGITAFVVFITALIVFGFLNREFSFLNDYISKLGAKGEPYAIWWNIIGFLVVLNGFMVYAINASIGFWSRFCMDCNNRN